MTFRHGFLIAALLLPAFAGCTLPGQGPDEWDLTLPVGILVSSRAGSAVDDVGPAAEMAATSLTASDVGLKVVVSREETADSPVAALDRLAQKKVAVVVAAVAPGDAQALLRRAVQQKLPVVLVTPVEAPLSAADAAYALVLAPPARAEAGALASLLTDEGAPRVSVLRADDAFAAATAAALDAAYENVVANATFTSRNAGSAAAAGRAACASAAEGIVVLGHPEDAGNAVRGLEEAGCRARMRVFAGALARQPDFPETAGRAPNQTNLAAGAMGVEPRGSRLPEFRSVFETEHGRAPGPFAAEAYDAVVYAALAAFHAKGSSDADPVEATVTKADVQGSLLGVAESPGAKQGSVSAALEAAKAKDDLDFLGFAHDFDFSDARLPEADAWTRWSVTTTGSIESGRSVA